MTLYVKRAHVNNINDAAPPEDADPIIVNDQPGATIDDKFDAALALWGESTVHRRVEFRNGDYTLTRKRAWAEGLQWGGPLGQHPGEAAKSSLNLRPCTINLGITSVASDGRGLFYGTSTASTRGIGCSNMAFKGGSAAAVFTMDSESVNSWVPRFRDLTCSGQKHVFGTDTVRFVSTGGEWCGYWNVNNGTHWSMRFCGSDNGYFLDGGLLDSPSGNHPGGTVGHIDFSWSDKCRVGDMYVTATGLWHIQVNGPSYNTGSDNLGGPIVFSPGFRLEGHNRNDPCTAPNGILYQRGGMVKLMGTWLAFTTAVNGAHQCNNGYVMHDGVTYSRATPGGVLQPETYPMARLTGASVGDFSHASVGSMGGAWTNPRPQITDATVAPGFVVKDGTYR